MTWDGIDFFRGDGVARLQFEQGEPRVLSDEALEAQTRPDGYRLRGESGQTLVAAVNVALALRLPLLVSGEPGSGKTQLAYAIAHELGRPTPVKFVTKSTSQSRDLLYTYDAVQHFRASQAGAAGEVRDYIDYAGLGIAILAGLPLAMRRRFLSAAILEPSDGDADLTPEQRTLRDILRRDDPTQLVLLIDEIDKATRDFPNDLLDEIDTMTFRVPELGGAQTPRLDPAYRPIVVITTNAERALPDAFLRRCAYAHLPCPTGEALEAILASRLSAIFAEGSPLVADVQAFFESVRSRQVLDKDPGVAELLRFLQALAALGAPSDAKLHDVLERALVALPTLGKSQADQSELTTQLSGWVKRSPN